ncbi:MAG: hypothetical protein IJ381_08510 [Clostridia bacterium]|nr:hypothetical protein [Clostridia bacterium]
MENMSLRAFPAAAPRKKRRYFRVGYTDIGGAYFGERDYIVSGGVFYDGGRAMFEVDAGTKQMAALGDLLYIFPDKIVYDTKSQTYEDLNAAEIEYTAIPGTSGEYEGFSGFRLYNNGGAKNKVRLQGSGDEIRFVVDDIIEITAAGGPYILSVLAREEVQEDGESYVYLTFADNALSALWGDIASSVASIAASAKLRYAIPDMDFVFASDNRLWGAKGREIYASRLGDGKTWQDYDTLATSSWAATTATGDTITAALDFSGTPVFFCENAIYKIYGENPKEYEYARSSAIGVMAGEHRSAAVGGGYVFYLSRRGVCAYTGGIPQVISDPLGEAHLSGGVGGTDGVEYYLSVPEAGRHSLFVWDTRHNLWVREDGTRAEYIGMRGKNLCCIDASGAMFTLGDAWDTGGAEENGFAWYMESGDYNDGSVDTKIAKNLIVQYELPAGKAEVLVSFDREEWVWVGDLFQTYGQRMTTIIALDARRYRTMRVAVRGEGDIIIYYLVRDAAAGSVRAGGENNVYL